MPKMLDAASLQRYVGGEAEVVQAERKDPVGMSPWPPLDYRFRGQISSISLDEGIMRIEFEWLAKNLGGGSAPTNKWEAGPKGSYVLAYFPYPHFTLNEKDGVMEIHGLILQETVWLIPPGGDALNPDDIEGFPPEHYQRQLARFRLAC